MMATTTCSFSPPALVKQLPTPLTCWIG